MRTDDLGARLRKLETFHNLRVPPGAWTIIRVDGCGFSRLTAEYFKKPFDERCSQAMIAAACALVERFQGVYAYTESDEISLLLPRTSALFERRIEKLISLTAAVASATFTSTSGIPGTFDSRICIAATDTDVIDVTVHHSHLPPLVHGLAVGAVFAEAAAGSAGAFAVDGVTAIFLAIGANRLRM
jgi:tRNA(His) 5'-end guanylyltransferase